MENYMISVSEALALVNEHLYTCDPIEISLGKALHYTLAETINAPINMPPFRQSAMDGYAINLHNKDSYRIIGEVKAGDAPDFKLNPGEAVRIFTGAAVPDTANAVIMQENAQITDRNVIFSEIPKQQQNIRPLGEQIKKGDEAIAKNTVLSPTVISFLASLGIDKVNVYPRPKIGIVVTGSELITPGSAYQEGKIYESNSILLQSVLEQENITNVSVYSVADNYEHTKNTLAEAIKNSDFVLVSGGISVGDYDFVGKALQNLHTKQLFYKIKQKPGKPLFFGKNQDTYVFALPGNPASALTCFYMYALPMLRAFSKHPNVHLKRKRKKLVTSFNVKGTRAQFLKAIYNGQKVSVLNNQSSAMIHGFHSANCLVYLPEGSTLIKDKTEVEVIIIP